MEAQLTEEQYQRVLQVFWDDESIETLQTPEELHQFVWNYNWDGGFEIIEEVINHPLCDIRNSPAHLLVCRTGYLYQYATADEAPNDYHYKLVSDLEAKILSGGFPSSEIAFDPTNDEGYDWTTRYQQCVQKRQIPEAMYQPVEGVQLQRASF